MQTGDDGVSVGERRKASMSGEKVGFGGFDEVSVQM